MDNRDDQMRQNEPNDLLKEEKQQASAQNYEQQRDDAGPGKRRHTLGKPGS